MQYLLEVLKLKYWSTYTEKKCEVNELFKNLWILWILWVRTIVHEIGNEDNIGSNVNLKIGISKMEDESKKYINFLEGCQCKNTVTLNAFYDYLDQA